MRTHSSALCAVLGATLWSASAIAQTLPTPSTESPRIQSVQWAAGETIVLTALPDTTLTVMLEPNESIQRAILSGSRSWNVEVAAETNGLQVTPQFGAATATLKVETDLRSYDFALETGQGLMAAYVVRLVYEKTIDEVQEETPTMIMNLAWDYRVRGDREVRPVSVRDNGEKTVIEYAPGQPLPAVFAIGASGDEEVVDGYMRGGLFVIDRVHQELVFRIDREKATARRNRREENGE